MSMKVKAFCARPNEAPWFEKFSKTYDIDLTCDPGPLNMDTVDEVNGFEGVSIVHDGTMTDDLMKACAARGVKYFCLRTIGYDGINLKLAEELGVHFSNAGYSAYSVANYTVMMMLMCLRKALYILLRSHTADYSLGSAQGKEMQNQTVGIIGTGRIGKAVIENLQGFGCKVLAYDIYPSKDLKGATYVSLDELYAQSDIISLHTYLSPETEHMIDAAALSKMKDGVILINCARGGLMNTEDVIAAIESGKVGAAGIDCFEGEEDIVRFDHNYNRRVTNHDYIILKSFQNTIVSPHVAFYTDQAVADMVENSLRSLRQFADTGKADMEVHPRD